MLLITGITGHSGQYFLQQLIDNNYEGTIRCVVREASNTTLLDKSGLQTEKIVGDLNDQDTLDKAMVGVDVVIHISSIFYSVNVMKAAVKNNVKRAIFVHTTGIYSKYISASAEYKHIEETISEIIKKSKSPIGLIYLRPTMIYGYYNDRNMIVFIKMVDRLRLFPVINHGENLLQPVNGKDLGVAYYQVLMNTDIMNGDYILSGERPIAMIDLFKLIGKLMGKKTRFISVPLVIGVLMGRICKFITLGYVDYVEKVQRMGEDRSFPHDKASRDFGYKPMTLAQGLKYEIDDYLYQKSRK